MPEFPIIDSHVHLWDPRRLRMRWLDDLEPINRPFGPADHREHAQGSGADIAGIVFMEVAAEPAYGLLEAHWANAHAEEEPRLRAIIARAPVEDGEQIRFYLRSLATIGPRIKGVRRLIEGEPDPDFCLRPEFVRGVRLLPEFGFSFDICIKHHQLAAAVELVRQCPEASFIPDHIAKPNMAAGARDPWREQLRTLGELPNVVCKLSGMVTEADHAGWAADDLAPYVAHVLEVFGEDRVMFGGDWPVVLLASSYARWIETLDALTTQRSPEARRKLWAENARRVYRLDQ